MSELPPTAQRQPSSSHAGERSQPVRSTSMPGASGLMLAGLGLLALGALAFYYMGPDLQRYLKIRSM